MRPQRLCCAVVFAALALAVFPALGRASVVELYDDTYGDYTVLIVYGSFGEENAVTLDGDARRVTVTDAAAPLSAGFNCEQAGPNAAVCTAPSGRALMSLQTSLGDGADRLTDNVTGLRESFGFPGSHYHDGGDGRDRLTGSDGDPDTIRGGRGGDLANGRGGDDTLVEETFGFGFGFGDTGDDNYLGGAGDDVLNGGVGSDFLDGGPGIDRVEYARPLAAGEPGVRADLRGTSFGNGQPGENDILAGNEDVLGSSRADTLIGSEAGNVLDGFMGDDAITGGGGADTLFGRQGNDDLQAQDGGPDRVSCGGEAGDRAAADAEDDVSGCASVSVAPLPAGGGGTPAADREAPRITVTAPRRIARRALLRRGLPVRVSSRDAVRNRVTGTLTARPRIRRAAAGDLVLAQRGRSFLRRTSLRLKPVRRVRGAVRRGSRLRLRVVVQDAAGNRATRSVRVRVT